MSTINSNEIISILKEKIVDFDFSEKSEEVGTVISVGDGIATIYGMEHVMYGEIVVFENGVKGVVLPAGGHAVYINMDEFFDGKRDHTTFAGTGFSLELIRRYGIRVSELGDFSMEYDLKTPEQQAELANVVRFAIDRSRLTKEHLDYVIAAVAQLYKDRESIPNMRILWGHKLPMRHFHAFLEPYPNEEK